MIRVGRMTRGSTAYTLAEDTKRVARFNLAEPGNLVKGSAYIDGLGGGIGAQMVRLVIYDASSALIAASRDETVQLGQPVSWVDFVFPMLCGRLELPVGDLFAGLQGGGYGSTIRLWGDAPAGMGGKHNADAFADGPASPFGSATADTGDLSIYLTCFTPYAPPNETDLYFARLPFMQAQAVFRQGGAEIGSARSERVGWHDTFTDPETGSNALVRAGSPLEGLLGERLRVRTIGTVPTREVYVYVHDLAPADFDWDLSLSRHMFGQLGLLAEDTIGAIVEVIS